MVAAVIAFPVLVTGGIEKVETLSSEQIMNQLDQPSADAATDPTAGMDTGNKEGEAPGAASDADKDDPMKAMLEAAEKDAKKKP
jgi:hypothetical protein